MKWFSRYRMRLMFAGMSMAVAVGIGEIAEADFTFGEPVNLGPVVNSASNETVVCLSPDHLEMYFISDRPGGSGDWDIWVTERASTDANWGPPENLGPTVNSPRFEGGAQMSPDGLTLYFQSRRLGGLGSADIWTTTRLTEDDQWTIPVNLGQPVNSSHDEQCPAISADGLELYFHSSAQPGGVGDSDIWVSTRLSVDEPWGEPTNLGSVVNTTSREEYKWLSPDGLLFFFDSDRPGGAGSFDIWITRRASKDDPWTTPVNPGPPVNGPSDDALGAIAPNGQMLYFLSGRTGGLGGEWGDIWQAPILPVVDFNGDGRVDGFEFTKLVDHWGKYDPSCDIGPTPLGDGVVDVQDVVVLADYIGQDIDDPTLIAHWTLDETEGYVAHDSAGQNDADVIGEAVWQPSGGVVDGALLLDGVNDCLATDAVCDPSEGSLSILTWVQGGVPGQVIVSQIAGVSWLATDEVSGALKTDLKESGRSGKSLVSDTVITDGDWHRVGLVWDGTNRSLYVDDVLVATDTRPGLVGSGGGLNIGCDKNMTPGTFWAGMIDDARIYNRAVKP